VSKSQGPSVLVFGNRTDGLEFEPNLYTGFEMLKKAIGEPNTLDDLAGQAVGHTIVMKLETDHLTFPAQNACG
jgi:hypothetical protein